MKKINAKDLKAVGSLAGQRIMLDANIWLLMDGPQYGSLDSRASAYSDAYYLLRKQNRIIINDYVIGEFINRYLKIEFNTLREAKGEKNFPDYKNFRSSKEFKPILDSVADTATNIIEDCEFVPIHITEEQLKESVQELCAGEMDLTDITIRACCKANGFVLMTDDRDFIGCGLDLITCNKKLLAEA